MKVLKTALMAAAASVAMAGAAHAGDFSFNVGAASDYIFRGLDQSFDQEGELFGGVDWTHEQFYAGTWLSNTGPDGDQAVEYDIYAGFKPKIGGATLDLGAIFYGYTNSDTGAVGSYLNTVELKAAASFPLGPFSVGGAAYYAPENGGFGDESSLYLEANAAYTFGDGGPTVSAAVGNFSWDSTAPVDSYVTYNVGVTFPVGDKFSVDARYYGTDSDAETAFGPDIADDFFVVSGKFVF